MSISENCMEAAYFNAVLKKRVEFFLVKASISAMGEVAPTGDEHTARVSFSNTVRSNGYDVQKYAVGVVAHSTISPLIDAGTDITDSVLESAVNSLFSKYAGYDQ